ncbi:hypothetical protein GGS23DRAFT_577462 [Durotheca rogersii]|uniref:uncharacterized protein n=1 Tax=Durotheca rogersii TaxID=419775 RepID=UPI00222042D3|nr:uncharacterized protein GGS23DRAFT_577462 [Durotheca rogersii]KAI5861173.1 hypothetical protein GGS23DRAFT_577462 [Durotheca rogersii]
MGLRLFTEPVKSDIPPRQARGSPADPATARSRIRRVSPTQQHSERRRHLQESRENRLRMLVALQDRDDHHFSSAIRLGPRGRGATQGPLTHGGSYRAGIEDPELTPEVAALFQRPDRSEDANSYFHIRTRPAANASPQRPSLFDRFGDDSMLHQISNRQGPVDESAPSRVHSDTPAVQPASPSRAARAELRDPIAYRRRQRIQQQLRGGFRLLSPSPPPPPGYSRPGPRVRYVDGLGDRDRSLSPEGDGVWDILQSTLAPDPQPPSVGSSFGSAHPSIAVSQRTTRASASTSVTSPGDETEFPCDPVNDTDGEDDAEGHVDDDDGVVDSIVESQRLHRLSARRGVQSWRDYAATMSSQRNAPDNGVDGGETRRVRRLIPPLGLEAWQNYADMADAASSLPSAPDDPLWLDGMHRIVRGLASREDIPDEWWAEAGLTRSMSWDGSH